MKVSFERVASIGYPLWGIHWHRVNACPAFDMKSHILIEIDVPWTQYEVRVWMGAK